MDWLQGLRFEGSRVFVVYVTDEGVQSRRIPINEEHGRRLVPMAGPMTLRFELVSRDQAVRLCIERPPTSGQ
ncbi:MAG: hypothetical protein ACRDWD_01775 [Acidimicrobiia bacterium]